MNNASIMTDTSVKIPASVLASSARAERLHQELYNKTQTLEEPIATAPLENEGLPVAVVENTLEAPVTNPVPVTPESNSVDYERQYKSMKGRFEQATSQLKAMGEQVHNLNNLVSSLQAQVKAPPAELQAAKFITDEEEQEYGSEFLGVVGKKAKEIMNAENKLLRDKLEALEAQFGNVATMVSNTSQQDMENTLDVRSPNWRNINENENFISWLGLPDTLSGAIRHELLKAAWDRKDGHRVAAFFNGFLSEEAVVDPVGHEPHLGESKIPLETFAAPGRAKTAAAGSAPAEKPSFTRAQLTAFYADVNSGKFRGREAEKDRIESQIFEAGRDGRIR